MNDEYRDLKARIRRLDALMRQGGSSHLPFAQAVSAVQRAERHGDRTRPPSTELMSLLEKAERLSGAFEHS